MHPGYVRLILESNNTAVHHETLWRNSDLKENEERRGPAIKENQRTWMTELVSGVGPNSSNGQCKRLRTVYIHDVVPAMHCPCWPTEASEWMTRTRHHACPSKSVIKQVVRYGCDFVGVAHQLSSDEQKTKEWRFSFSMAELLIIHSWTRAQRIAYRTVRLAFKRIQQQLRDANVKCVLCTYYFKTLMLWACEQQPPRFWTDFLPVDSVRYLLMKMSDWLASRHCPNYFIPSNNMMDHLADVDVSADVTALRLASESVDVITNHHMESELYDNRSSSMKRYAEMPAWLSRGLLIVGRKKNLYDSHKSLFTAEYSKRLRTTLRTEMRSIYQALLLIKEVAAQHTQEVLKHYYLSEVEYLLCTAATLCESEERERFELGDDSEMIASFFNCFDYDHVHFRRQTSDQWISDFFATKHEANENVSARDAIKCLVYRRRTRATQFLKRSPAFILNKASTVSFTGYNVTKYNPDDVLAKRYFRHILGTSPTVNAAWFIAKAYLANFYYTLRGDYKATIETCDDIIHVFNQSSGNEQLAERSLPLLVSTQWTAVYDQELQSLLGFLPLSVFVLSKSQRRSVNLGVCPVQFALYLKCLCAMDRDENEEFRQRMAEYWEHTKICKTVRWTWAVGKILLNIAGHIHYARVVQCFKVLYQSIINSVIMI